MAWAPELIPALVASFLIEEADPVQDGWLLDLVIPRIACLNREHYHLTQRWLTERQTFRAEFFADSAEAIRARGLAFMEPLLLRWWWRDFNADYAWRARTTAISCVTGSSQPLLRWGVGTAVFFLCFFRERTTRGRVTLVLI